MERVKSLAAMLREKPGVEDPQGREYQGAARRRNVS